MARTVALYDKSGEHRLWWIGDNLWNLDMKWIAYIYEGDAFNSREDHWLGPVKRSIVMDRRGRVLLWGPGVEVTGEAAPYRPASPYRPPRPEKPYRPHQPPPPSKPPRPSDGWSPLSLKEWFRGGPPEERDSEEPENAGIQPDLISFDD